MKDKERKKKKIKDKKRALARLMTNQPFPFFMSPLDCYHWSASGFT